MLPICWKLGLIEVPWFAPRHTERKHQIREVPSSLPLLPCCPCWHVGSWNLPWPGRTRAASVPREAGLRGSESLGSKVQLQTCASRHLGPDLSFSICKWGWLLQ